MSPDLGSVEDNSIAEEVDTFPVEKSNAHVHCHAAMCRFLPIIGMSSDLQHSLRLRLLFITSCTCTCARKCTCSQLCFWCNMWPKMQQDAVTRAHRPPSLHIHPSSLIIFASSTINLMDLLCFCSLVMKSIQSKTLHIYLLHTLFLISTSCSNVTTSVKKLFATHRFIGR